MISSYFCGPQNAEALFIAFVHVLFQLWPVIVSMLVGDQLLLIDWYHDFCLRAEG
jgi:hypothetical protein